jgi:NAD(P)-dependent dehydrogenase (short-subunit alcohol dehydrogenase family)
VLLSAGEDITAMRFTGQVALITAAASGIGKATAEIVGRGGGTVVGVDTDQGRLEKVVATLRDAGGRARGG